MNNAILKERSTNFFYKHIQPVLFLTFSTVLALFPHAILAVPPVVIAADYMFKQWITYKQREFVNATIVEVLELCKKVDTDHADLLVTMEALNKNIVAVDAKLRSIPGWNQQ